VKKDNLSLQKQTIMSTKQFKDLLPILVIAFGILITSCSNNNNIQFHKSQRLAKTSMKSEKKQSFSGLKEEGFAEYQTETDPQLTISANVFASQNNDNTQLVKVEKKTNLKKLINTNHLVKKHVKPLIQQKTNRNDETDKSRERKTFDVVHWILVGLLSVLLGLAFLGFIIWEFFIIVPIFVLLLLVSILSIRQGFFLSNKVPENERDPAYKLRKILALIAFVFSLVGLALLLVIVF